MAYPQPTYRASMIGNQLCNMADEEKAKRAYKAFKKYLGENAFLLQKDSSHMYNDSFLEKFTCITEESIVVQSVAETKKGKFHTERIPTGWSIDLSSFANPVDKLKKDLEAVVKRAVK